jgi:hypothetical protein
MLGSNTGEVVQATLKHEDSNVRECCIADRERLHDPLGLGDAPSSRVPHVMVGKYRISAWRCAGPTPRKDRRVQVAVASTPSCP